MKLSRLPIYKRVFLLFIILILPVYILSITFIINGGVYIRENRALSIQNQIDFIRNQLHYEFRHIMEQQVNLLSNRTIQDLNFLTGVIDNYDKVKKVQTVEELLFSTEHSSKLIGNVGLHLSDAGFTLSSKNGFKRGESEDKNIYDEYLRQGKKAVFLFNERIILFRAYPLAAEHSDASIAYGCFVELSLENLNKMLNTMILEKGSKIMLKSRSGNFIFPFIKMDSENYQVSSHDLDLLDLELITYIPGKGISGPLSSYYLLILLFIVISLFVFFLFTFFLNRMIHQPLNRFIKAFHKVEDENFNVLTEAEGYGEFAYLYDSFRKIVKRLKDSIEALYKNEIALKQAEYKHLQSQINPHFLYNSFFIVSKLCREEDIERAGSLTAKLGSYFRFITRNAESEIPLEKEVQHIRDYTDIQSVRFGRRIKVSIEPLPERASKHLVPRIILQPILENAYEHAFNDILEGGLIDIGFKILDEKILISISDNGKGISGLKDMNRYLETPGLANEKTALINISERLKLKFGSESGVLLEQNGSKGLSVILKMDLSNSPKEVNRT